MIEQAKFIYSPLGKALEKQTKTMEDQEKKTKRFYHTSKRKASGFY